MFKIADKADLYVVTSNRRFGVKNYQMLKVEEDASAIIPCKLSDTVQGAGLVTDQLLVMRQRPRKIIRLLVEIAQYEELSSVMKTGALFFEDMTVAEALHSLARKGSILIPAETEHEFGLFKDGKQMLPNSTLSKHHLKEGDTVILARKTDHKLALTVLIDDWVELNCVRKTSHLFSAGTTVSEARLTIGKKPAINVAEDRIAAYDLLVLNTGQKLAAGDKLGEVGLAYGDTIILRKGDLDFSQMKISDFKIVDKIGRGSFGMVYRALYHGHEVAIKIQPAVRAGDLKKEADLMSGLDHENIVKLFGKMEDQGQVCVVLELCERGSLFHVLQDPLMNVGWDRFFSFTRGIFRGVEYLHGHKPHALMHRDIKSLNVLVGQDMRVRLADFGQSTEQRVENLKTMAKMRGTPAWSPPEMIDSKTYTVAGDVYSAGITVWEILFKTMFNKYERPMSEYKDLQLDVQIMIVANKGKRPTIPANTPEGVANYIQKLWSNAPNERPTAREALDLLEPLSADYEAHVTAWDAPRKLK